MRIEIRVVADCDPPPHDVDLEEKLESLADETENVLADILINRGAGFSITATHSVTP